MSRYQFLRAHGFDPFAAWFIAAINRVRDIPPNEIRFLGVTIEMED